MEEKKAHVSKEKLETVKKLVEQLKKHKTVMILSIKSLPSQQFQKMKKELRGKAEEGKKGKVHNLLYASGTDEDPKHFPNYINAHNKWREGLINKMSDKKIEKKPKKDQEQCKIVPGRRKRESKSHTYILLTRKDYTSLNKPNRPTTCLPESKA